MTFPITGNSFLGRIWTNILIFSLNFFYFEEHFLKTLNQEDLNLENDLMGNAVKGEKCYRPCSKDPKDQKVCHFKFNLEYYQVLGG